MLTKELSWECPNDRGNWNHKAELSGKYIKLKFLVLVSLYLYVSLISKGSAKLEKAEILQMTVDHLKMLQATGGKGKEPTIFFFLIFGEISTKKSALRSCDRRFQIKGVEINANGRIELVGKNYWDKRSTWPWACVCFHNTVGVKASFTGSPVRDLFGVSKEHWNLHRETKQIHKHQT